MLRPARLKTHKKCWCAAEVDLRHGDGTCDVACTGDAGTTCGGYDAFDLFALVGTDPPPQPSEDYYLGCFADDDDDRVLGGKTSSRDMSLQVTAAPPTARAAGRE